MLGADPAQHTLTGPYTHESMFHEVFVLFGYLAALTEDDAQLDGRAARLAATN